MGFSTTAFLILAALGLDGSLAWIAAGEDGGALHRQQGQAADSVQVSSVEISKSGQMRARPLETRAHHDGNRAPVPTATRSLGRRTAESTETNNLLEKTDVSMPAPHTEPEQGQQPLREPPGSRSPSLMDGWCGEPQEAQVCARLWWCGGTRFVISTCTIVGLWSGLFLFLAWFVYPRIELRLKQWPSTVQDEEGGNYFAWLMQSSILAMLVVAMALMSLPVLWRAPATIQLAPPTPDASLYYDSLLTIAEAAHIFVCYIIADLIMASILKLITMDMVIHHLLFILVGVIITFNCFGALLAGALLLMEASTPFLNFFLYFRHRWGYESSYVEYSFYFFAVAFLAFRLVVFPLSCAYFFYHLVAKDTTMNVEVLPVSIGIIGTCLALAVVVQFMWAVQIGRKALRFRRAGESAEEAAERKADRMEKSKPLLSESSGVMQPPVAG